MGRLAALHLAGAGHRITIISRSAERGRHVLERLVGSQHRLVVGPLQPDLVASSRAVVLAGRSREPILSEAHLEAGAPPWTIDLSTPAAVSKVCTAMPQSGIRILYSS